MVSAPLLFVAPAMRISPLEVESVAAPLPAVTLPAAMPPPELICTVVPLLMSPETLKRPVPLASTTSLSAATDCRVMPWSAWTATFCFDVTLAAVTFCLEVTVTPSLPEALPIEILPSADSDSSPALAAISPLILTPAPFSVTTILIRSACMAPSAEPSMAYSGVPDVAVRAVASPVA